MNLADELENRRKCRCNLNDVLVAVDDAGPSLAVSWTEWDRHGRLVVRLSDGRAFRPERLHLRSPWFWGCCRPSRRNAWNPREPRGRRAAARPPA